MQVKGRDKLKKYKTVINLLVKFFGLFGRSVNVRLLNFFRNTNGITGILLRYIFFKNCCEQVGDNVSIRTGVYLLNTKKLRVGNNVSIHPMCYIDAAGGLAIGDDVSIAHNCSILTTNHQWDDIAIPIKYNKELSSSVSIENDVLLLPSYTEGLPRVTLEAMAFGKPVIANPVGGIIDVVINNHTGYVTDFNAVDDYYKSILELLNDKQKYEEISKNCINLVKDNYSEKNQEQAISKYYG